MKSTEAQRTYQRTYYLVHRERILARTGNYAKAHRENGRAYSRKCYWRHPEKPRERAKAWKRANLELVRITYRKWEAAHREQRNAHVRAWRVKHPDWGKSWRLAHPELVVLYSQQRRTRKHSLPDTLTVAEWGAICASYKDRCAYCGKKQKLTMDHVIPLSKGGGTIAFNIVPACGLCNNKKRIGPPLKPVNLAMGI